MGADTIPIIALSTVELRERLAKGSLKASQVARAYLERIEAEDERIGAWQWIDPEFVVKQAEGLDKYRETGRPVGPLHGVPVGIKDIVDTARIPTENGCLIDKGRVPTEDAAIVTSLKKAGALIMGKTVTTELAYLHPAKTRNPHNIDHTPGGSSSGSAAAIAAAMVPLSIGTQTGGSVIRPAAYCGVTGFKPTFGAIPRTGVLRSAPSLDTIGVFGRRPEDAALLADALFGFDERDPATSPAPSPHLFETAISRPPLEPVFAFLKPPQADQAEDEMVAAFNELREALGDRCFEVELPEPFEEEADIRWRIYHAELARCYHRYGRTPDKLGKVTLEAIEAGNKILARDYLAALDWRDVYNSALEKIFERADVIVTYAATGPAPKGLESTGNPVFNGLWTFCGTPAVSIPILTAENGLPIGVQLVGARGNDGRLLRTARWLFDWAMSQQAE